MQGRGIACRLFSSILNEDKCAAFEFPMNDIGYRGRLGAFWKVDDKGYLVNDAGLHKIQPEFVNLVDITNRVFIQSLGRSMHSCYLTGSIPRGIAVRGLSDLDAFAILKKGKVDPGKKRLYHGIGTLNISEVTEFQLEVWEWTDLFNDNMDRVTEFQAILKLNSQCIFGEDLSKHIAPIKPGIALANTEVFQFKLDVEEMLKAIDKDNSPENVAYWSKRIIKNLVRICFYMTIPLESCYTRDLNLSAKIFLKHYPDKLQILHCLKILDSPFSDPLELKEYFKKGFGKWAFEETKRWLQKYNPRGVASLPRDV